MPEGVGYGPQNTASVGKDIHIVGNHAYAASGAINFDDNETDLINTTLGNYYIKAFMQFGVLSSSSDDVTVTVYFNEVKVMEHTVANTHDVNGFGSALRLTIPAYTGLRITLTNIDSTTRNGFCIVTGRIYK